VDAKVKQEAQLMLRRNAFRGHSRSPNMVSFVLLGMISYYCAIDFVPKKCGFEIFDLQKNVVTLKSGSEVTQGHRN